jgi:hypothetical protein
MKAFEERMPLRHVRFSQVTLGVGILMLVGALLMMFSRQGAVLWGMGLGFMGLATVFTSIIYWGCGNKSCSPWD